MERTKLVRLTETQQSSDSEVILCGDISDYIIMLIIQSLVRKSGLG